MQLYIAVSLCSQLVDFFLLFMVAVFSDCFFFNIHIQCT